VPDGGAAIFLLHHSAAWTCTNAFVAFYGEGRGIEMACPCGGGQSCIVDRRCLGGWVHEDTLLLAAGLPLREHCGAEFTDDQQEALLKWWGEHGYPDSVVREQLSESQVETDDDDDITPSFTAQED